MKITLDRRAKIGLLAVVAVLVLVIGLAGFVFLNSAIALGTGGRDLTDHALLDTTGGVGNNIQCGTLDKSFLFFLSARAVAVDTAARVTFQDGDFIDFSIPAGQTISMTQAAGGTPGVDMVLKVEEANPALNQLTAWASILTQTSAVPPFAGSFCVTG